MSTPARSDAERLRLAATFEHGADLYDRVRPDFPDAAVDLALPPGARRVLDLGAGTGKLTASVVARELEVVAIDPSPSMLGHLCARFPAVETHVATAEQTGLPDASVDAIVVGSAFHWFARPAAEAEMTRVLRPGGRVALLWNRRDQDSPVTAVFDRVRRRRDRERPDHREDVVLDPTWFGPTERHVVPHTQRLTPEQVIDLMCSRSYVLDMTDDERAGVRQELRDALSTDPATAGRGMIDIVYRTLVLRADRSGG